jgi:hypothetical protein
VVDFGEVLDDVMPMAASSSTARHIRVAVEREVPGSPSSLARSSTFRAEVPVSYDSYDRATVGLS